MLDMDELKNLVRENMLLKTRIDEMSSIQSEIKAKLKEAVLNDGQEDDKGHVVLSLDEPVAGVASIVNQRRVSKSLDESAAETLLASKDLTDRCLKMVPVLDEDEIMKAYYEGLITEEDIDTMFPSKVTYALVMTKS
jgi:predicted RNA-binding protein associated with RNAse of E/G family